MKAACIVRLLLLAPRRVVRLIGYVPTILPPVHAIERKNTSGRGSHSHPKKNKVLAQKEEEEHRCTHSLLQNDVLLEYGRLYHFTDRAYYFTRQYYYFTNKVTIQF